MDEPSITIESSPKAVCSMGGGESASRQGRRTIRIPITAAVMCTNRLAVRAAPSGRCRRIGRGATPGSSARGDPMQYLRNRAITFDRVPTHIRRPPYSAPSIMREDARIEVDQRKRPPYSAAVLRQSGSAEIFLWVTLRNGSCIWSNWRSSNAMRARYPDPSFRQKPRFAPDGVS